MPKKRHQNAKTGHNVGIKGVGIDLGIRFLLPDAQNVVPFWCQSGPVGQNLVARQQFLRWHHKNWQKSGGPQKDLNRASFRHQGTEMPKVFP